MHSMIYICISAKKTGFKMQGTNHCKKQGVPKQSEVGHAEKFPLGSCANQPDAKHGIITE